MSLFKKRAAPATSAIEPTGERRQLTVLFYDIVGSTSLVDHGDPEALRAALELIHAAARDALHAHGGSLEQVMGDGGMAYFGHPVPNEDAALSAVNAALDLLEARSQIALAPNIRIGIATSIVVLPQGPQVGTSGRLGAVGVAPNLAARLESAAAVNSVLVGEVTYQLTRRAVDYAPVADLTLKGFPDVTRAWQPLALRPVASRFDRDRDTGATLTGRDAERKSLRDAWYNTAQGAGTGLLIQGEPGIGKSRILADLTQFATDARVMILQSQPRTQGEALFSIITMYDRAYEADTDPALVQAALDTAQQLETLEQDATLPSDARRDAVVNAVVAHMMQLTQDAPLLILAEDLHWADEVTLAVLERLSLQASGARLMVVATARPDADLQDLASAMRAMPLGPIPPDYAISFVRAIATTDLAPETIDWIVARGDGNPLFLAELTAFAGETLSLGKALSDVDGAAIRSLGDLLSTRLESAGVAKRTAQIASVLGREYPYHLLTKLTGTFAPGQLDADLQRLVEHGLKDIIGNGYTYAFRHALVRDVAYDSQLRSVRQKLHGAIVDLVDADPSLADAVPDILLAEHCLAADRVLRGTSLLVQVAEEAIRRSALRAPRAMLERVLLLADKLVPSPQRDIVLVRAISLLGPLITLLDGPRAAAPLYDRGQTIYFALPDQDRATFFPVLWGWWFTASDLIEQARRAEVLIRDVTPRSDPESRLQALHCGWATLFDGGAHDRCLSAISDGLALYDADRGRQSRYLYGHDARVCGLGERALSGWLTGQLDLSATAVAQCEAWGDDTGHLASRLHGLDIATQVAIYRRDMPELDRLLTKMARLADPEAIPALAAKQQIFRGWQAARGGDTGQIAAVTQGLAALERFGILEDMPFYADIAAEITAASGAVDAALGPLDQAIAEARTSGLTYWLPELLRRKALLCTGGAAAAALDEGFSVAQGQNAQMLALRNVATRLDLGLALPLEHAQTLRITAQNVSDCALRQRVLDAIRV